MKRKPVYKRKGRDVLAQIGEDGPWHKRATCTTPRAARQITEALTASVKRARRKKGAR